MGDLLRWFKVWTTITQDPDFRGQDLQDVGRWTYLGALMASSGSKGRLTLRPKSLRMICQLLEVDNETALKSALNRLPNVSFEEGQNRDGTIVVTWKNWHKYQKDNSASRRMKSLRSKRRREEKRGEEIRKEPLSLSLPISGSNGDTPPSSFHTPPSVEAALQRCPMLGAVARLHHAPFWQAQVRATPGVDYAGELIRAEAWLVANPARAPRKDLARFMHTWLMRAAERSAL